MTDFYCGSLVERFECACLRLILTL